MAKSATPKTVKLTAPGGGETTVSDLVSLSSLHFGSGYKLPKGMSYAQAEEALLDQGEDLVLLNASAPTTTATVTPPAAGAKDTK